MAHYNRKEKLERLDYYYEVINSTILSKQNPATGLIPASVAITTHGDYTDAWVRDNVYSIYCVFGLALAYRRLDDDSGRTFELEHAVVKLMRGLLFCMMRQAHKVERFKKTQHVLDCLHAKYDTKTGDTVVPDAGWGHLQIDATSFFLVALADMTTSGLNIVFTQDEVDFVQNLVFYIERAYRTPDFGIWERGDKSNHGQPELNSSSIGMAVAALRAINGVNLFGARGGPSSVIYVLPDELTRNSATLKSVLPRESNSKEIDGSVLSIIGFPAFAVDDPDLVKRTREEGKKKLEGKYGWKRFLRDGHQTVVEDTSRLHYNDNELKIFENIESEWPLFFTYLILEGLYNGDMQQVEEYREKLQKVTIDSSKWDPEHPRPPEEYKDVEPHTTNKLSVALVPELYYVPRESIDEERAHPNTVKRLPGDNTPLVWSMSLNLLGCLMYEDLLSPSEIDPLGRRFNVARLKKETITQIVLLSEDEELQSELSTYGLETQTVDQISSSITVLPPRALADVYATLGQNSKLGLTGRVKRPIGVLGTSRLYRIEGHIYAFTPQFMDSDAFYLNADPDFLVSSFQAELGFASEHWSFAGRPTLIVVLTKDMLGGIHEKVQAPGATSLRHAPDMSKKNLLNFFMNLRSGICNGTRVRLSRISETLNTSQIVSLDFLIDKNVIDWQNILRVNKSAHHRSGTHRKLGYNQDQTQSSTPGIRTPGYKTPKRRQTAFQGKSLNTPLDKLHDEGYFQDIASALSKIATESQFRLKDHEHFPGDKKGVTDSYTPPRLHSVTESSLEDTAQFAAAIDGMLSLTLGDRSQFDQAVYSLTTSVNLYDQIDLLQYLLSCADLDFYIAELQATIKDLLEEVYLKSMRLHYWAIARQATGLLQKIVPSLTISITDLLILKKQVSIGSGLQEYLISTPVGPEILKKILGDHCSDDVREGPLVQEIIIYLGGFIRSMPRMFDGILRLRTHFIIIALREEISRMNNCNEEEAIEILMQLSPFELQSLLGTILSGPNLCEANHNILLIDRPGSLLPLGQVFGLTHVADDKDRTSSTSIPIAVDGDDSQIVIKVQAAGYNAGNFARVEVNSYVMEAASRGIHVWAVDVHEKLIIENASFDTHISREESEDFSKFIESLHPGIIVIIAGRDDFTEHLTPDAVEIMEHLGAKKIRNVQYRDSYALIVEKGSHEALESHKAAADGPTETLEKHITCGEKNKEITAENAADVFLSAHGRWLRRRKNDGALNRAPTQFFPRTWSVLNKCHGLKIHEHVLPRDPTVYERTPGEFNFALAVEGFLGWFTDPAERQIAVELLNVIYKIEEQNPDVQMVEGMVDIPAIMTQAQHLFWDHWKETNKARLEGSKLFEHGSDYEQHKDLIRKLFYDLPLDGKESTGVYLAQSAIKMLPAKFSNCI
ncbi:glycosyl hydrolases family 15-domain-containing protein [Radiomyces spectabilis]|uniref:glycosyl hydrolases family 15-domain-containing protein n=1 Tax=Radiomyces spectabilis TaxID=64574 RepID=UPI00221F4EA7|nr:glycosyl hydrolases family 15-domain-containing protein [Radiomyces spectabilis]KAI8393300.1 glycosyl hydrolases family 15-domain-containing protein [Radiomyces spectabilis]